MRIEKDHRIETVVKSYKILTKIIKCMKITTAAHFSPFSISNSNTNLFEALSSDITRFLVGSGYIFH